MTIKQISVFLANKPGGLADISEILGKNSIDIRALSIADTTDFGILRLIVSKPDEALSVLKAADFIVSVTEVVAVHIDDTPGGLAAVLRLLADSDITIEYLYAFVTRKAENAYVVFRVEDNGLACETLEKNGIRLASPDEAYRI